MIRSALCAGAAGMLSAVCFVSSASAEASMNPVETAASTSAEGVSYQKVLKEADSHANVYAGEAMLTQLLNDPSLTPKQHARVLYARAQHRWKKSSDKVGAFEDFTRFTELYPEDRYANNAGIEAGYVSDEIVIIEARMEELQTLSAWFEDAWVLGMRGDAAVRYKRSGLEPEPGEITRFQQTGYICEMGEGESGKGYRPVTPQMPNLYWCD